MSAKNQEPVFHRTKNTFEDSELDAWDDLAIVKAYDLSISKEPIQPADLETLSTSNNSDTIKMEEFEPAPPVGEMVWCRAPGIEIIEQSNSVEATSSRVSRKRKRRKKKSFNGASMDHALPWKVGDSCMALYPEDQHYYKATIQSVNPEQGTVVVCYEDYDEDEALAIKDIYPEHLWTDAGIDVSNSAKQGQQVKNSATNIANKKKKKRKSQQTRSRTSISDSSLPKRRVTAEQPPAFMPSFDGSLPNFSNIPINGNSMSKDAMSSMLVSWYMAGYHTGYYRGLSNRSDD